MTTILGTTENNCRLEVDWNGPFTVTHATKSVNVTGAVYFYSSVPVTDNANKGSWSGLFGSGSTPTTGWPENSPLRVTSGSGRRALAGASWSKTVTLTGLAQSSSLAYSLTNFDYASDDSLYINAAPLVIPARPAPPNVTNFTTVLDLPNNKVTCSWTLPAGLVSDEDIVIQRSTDGGTYTNIASLPETSTSWADTSIQANRKYHYRVAVAHPAAASAFLNSTSTIYTKPTAPVIGTPVKNGDGSITVPWTDQSAWEDRFEVGDSPDGTTWSTLSATVPAGSSTYSHTAPNQAVTHRYRVRALAPSGLASDWSGTSATVQLQAPPGAPSNLSPSGVPVDIASPTVFGWVHNPVDSSAQSAYEHRFVDAGGAQISTTGKVLSSARTATVQAPGSNGSATPRWQVRTWGAHATAGAWSDVASFPAYAVPVVTINSPTGALSGSSAAVSWTTSDAAGRPQGAATVTLYNSDRTVALRTVQVSGAGTSATLTDLVDATTYQIGVKATAGGQSSAEQFVTVPVTYATPPVPVLSVQFDHGAAVLSVEIPAGTPAAVSVEYYADGVLLGSADPGAAFIDRIPDLSGTTYTARAVSALPSSSTSTPAALDVPDGPGIHLNAGPAWGFHAAMWAGGPSVDWSADVDTTVETYAGDVLASATFGQSEGFELDLSGLVWFDAESSSRADWLSVVRARTLVCYRDRVRRHFGVLVGLGVKETNTLWGSLAVKFVETGHADADLAARSAFAVVEDPPGEWRVLASTDAVTILDLLT